MPIIKNKVIRNIPEQVAKNTSDILALKGGIDYSQAPFLGESWEYRNDKLVIKLIFAEHFIPVYVRFNFELNAEEGQIGFCMTRNPSNGAFVGHDLGIDLSGDITYSDFSLHGEDRANVELELYFDCEEPYDTTKFLELVHAEFILLKGEIDQ